MSRASRRSVIRTRRPTSCWRTRPGHGRRCDGLCRRPGRRRHGQLLAGRRCGRTVCDRRQHGRGHGGRRRSTARRPPATTSRSGPPAATRARTTRTFTIARSGDVDEFDVGAVVDTDAAANAVDENAVVGTAVGVTASASDADATTNAITYSLDDDAGGRFAIDANTGVVTVAGAIDREADGPAATSRSGPPRATARAPTRPSRSRQRPRRVRRRRGGRHRRGGQQRWPRTRRSGTVVGVTGLASDADATDTGHLLAGRRRRWPVRDRRQHRRGDGQRRWTTRRPPATRHDPGDQQ